MTKAELIERVYGGKHLPRELTKKTVAQIVDAVFTEMGDYFIRTRVSRNQGARLTYPGFGTFSKEKPVFHQAALNGFGLFRPPYGRLFDRLVALLKRYF